MTIFDKVVNYIEIEPALACVHVLLENILSFTKLMWMHSDIPITHCDNETTGLLQKEVTLAVFGWPYWLP